MGKLRCRKYISYISSAFIKVLNMLLGGGEINCHLLIFPVAAITNGKNLVIYNN